MAKRTKLTAEIEITGTNTASKPIGQTADELDRLGKEAKETEQAAKGVDDALDDLGGAAKKAGDATERAGKKVGGAGAAAKKGEGAFRQFGNFLKSRFVITLGDVVNSIRAAFEAIQEAASLEAQTNALRIQLAAQGQDFDTYLAKLDEVARGTVSSADLIKATSTALLLGIPADKIAELLDVARASAIATGTELSAAFADIATGIGRASPMILDNLGIMVKLGPAQAAYAAELGKTVEQLTEAEKKNALLNEVLRVGKSRVEQYGEAHSVVAEQIQRGKAELDDFGKSISLVATGAMIAFVIGLKSIALAMSLFFEGIIKVVKAQVTLLAQIPILGRLFTGLEEKINEADDAIDVFQQDTWKSIEAMSAAAKNSFAMGFGFEQAKEKIDKATQSVKDNTRAVEASNDAIENTVIFFDDAAESSDEFTAAVRRQRAELDGLATSARVAAAEVAKVSTPATLAEGLPFAGGSRFFNRFGPSSGSAPISGGTFTVIHDANFSGLGD